MTRHETLKAQHRCYSCGIRLPRQGAQLACAACSERRKWYNARYRLRCRSVEPVPGPNQIAHCGQWHHIVTLPWTCPRCKTILGLPMEETLCVSGGY